jgi:voltage-gated potassium channel
VHAAVSIVAVVVVGGTAYALVPMRGRFGWVGAVGAVAVLLLLAPLTLRRARSIAVSEQPVADAAVAIAFLLTVLVLGFASAYVVLADHRDQLVGLETKLDAVYFALTTLSTVGFGDIHAKGQAARLVVSLQVVVDVVFLAVAVRLLTGIASVRRTASPGPAGGARSRGPRGARRSRGGTGARWRRRWRGRPRRW